MNGRYEIRLLALSNVTHVMIFNLQHKSFVSYICYYFLNTKEQFYLVLQTV